MKKSLKIIIAGFALAFAMTTAFASTVANKNYLYVVTANKGSLQKVSAHRYNLVLQGNGRYVTYLSDRPNRVSGIISTKKFVGYWQKIHRSIAKNPPNANIEGSMLHAVYHGKEVQLSVNVELLDLNYNKKNQLVFHLKLMPKNKLNLKDIHFDHIALFIDGFCITCIG